MNEVSARAVERTIAYTESLLRQKDTSWKVARRGVILTLCELAKQFPECEREIKGAFDPFIVRQDNEHGVDHSQGRDVLIVEQVESDSTTKKIKARRHARTSSNVSVGVVASGRAYPAKILNLSRSGIGLEAAIRPPIGSTIFIGNEAAVVVRHFESGFAGQFQRQIEPDVFLSTNRL